MIDSLLPSLPPKRGGPVLAVVLHQTGQTDLDKIVDYYTNRRGANPQKVAPHYMVELHGTVRRFVPEDRIAYHAKMDHAEAQLYRLGFREWARWTWDRDRDVPMIGSTGATLKRYAPWYAQWGAHGVQSPLELVTGARPNLVSVGVEVQTPEHPTDAYFTPDQYAALGALLLEVTERHKIQVGRSHVLTHSDTSPLRRTSEMGPTDPPGSFRWPALWAAMGRPTPRRP